MIENKRPLIATIWCTTYNHEPYIRQCLDGFVMQETNFRYEVIVHDDASTDRTADIVREYAEKHPDVIIPIFETENQYSKKDGALDRIMKASCKGKYIAWCEGDDYWIDSQKLQKQVDIMEKFPDCSLTVSNSYSYNTEVGMFVEANPIPIKESRFLTMSELLREEGGLISTASMCFRGDLLEIKPIEFETPHVGDRPLRMWLALNGQVYYDVHPMTVYRIGSVGSFSQRSNLNMSFASEVLRSMNDFYDYFDIKTNHQYSSDIKYMKDRELYFYYLRINSLKRFICDYYKGLPFKNRIVVLLKYILAFFPPQIRKKIKRCSRHYVKTFPQN